MRKRRGSDALRSESRTVAAGQAPAVGPKRSRGAADAASHRLRRLEHWLTDERDRRALRRLRQRPALAVIRLADPVRGFRGLATALAARRGARPPTRLLETETRRPIPRV